MVRRAICLGGIAAAVSLTCLPSLAQNPPAATTVTTTTTTTDFTAPFSQTGEEVWALQQIGKAGFSDADIMSVLPLLQDLNYTEGRFYGRTSADVVYILSAGNMDSAAGSVDLDRARQHFRDRRNTIWGEIRHKIGDQKAGVLESLVEPMPQTITTAYTDEHMVAIDQILADWDKMRQAENTQNGAVTASVVTTTTTTTMPTTVTYYSFPALTTAQLIDLLQDRLWFAHGTEFTALQYRSGYPINSEEMTRLRQNRLYMWR